MSILDTLLREKYLNEALNKKDWPDNINQLFEDLFGSKVYEESSKWLCPNAVISLHDSHISNFSQRKKINNYHTNFTIDYASLYDNKLSIGYLKNCKFSIVSKESLRPISNRCLLNFLIDEQKHEIAFMYLDNGFRRILSVSYTDIAFEKGQETLFEQKLDI